MIRAESLLPLRTYTLESRKGVLGLLEGVAEGVFTLQAVEPENAQELKPRATSFHSCSVADIYEAGAGDVPEARQVKGPLTFRGTGVQLGERVFVTGAELSGMSKPVLASYLLTDALAPPPDLTIPFATVPITGPLAPSWYFIKGLLGGDSTPLCLACTAAGCFLMRRMKQSVAAVTDRELLDNIINLRYVLFIDPSLPPSAQVVYRLARNALVVGPVNFGLQLNTLQVHLRLSATPVDSANNMLITTPMAVSRNLLSIPEEDLKLENVQALQHPTLQVLEQPLLGWLQPQRRMVVNVVAQDGAAQALQVNAFSTPQWAVDFTLALPPFRPLRPGESTAMQTDQLQRLIVSLFQGGSILETLSLNQQSLDSFTEAVAHALTLSLNNADLFLAPLALRVDAQLAVSEGLHASLANGQSITVPYYASSPQAPRLAAYIAAMGAYGIKCTFTDWNAAVHGLQLS